jgi:hypothetical protein
VSLVSPGEVFRFYSPSRDLRTTFVVTELLETNLGRDYALVLLLDIGPGIVSFRGEIGQVIGWWFDKSDPEWSKLERVA